MEPVRINLYMEVISNAKAPGSTFAGEARGLLHELSDPDVRVHELLERIETQPSGTFEMYLRQQVRQKSS